MILRIYVVFLINSAIGNSLLLLSILFSISSEVTQRVHVRKTFDAVYGYCVCRKRLYCLFVIEQESIALHGFDVRREDYFEKLLRYYNFIFSYCFWLFAYDRATYNDNCSYLQ